MPIVPTLAALSDLPSAFWFGLCAAIAGLSVGRVWSRGVEDADGERAAAGAGLFGSGLALMVASIGLAALVGFGAQPELGGFAWGRSGPGFLAGALVRVLFVAAIAALIAHRCEQVMAGVVVGASLVCTIALGVAAAGSLHELVSGTQERLAVLLATLPLVLAAAGLCGSMFWPRTSARRTWIAPVVTGAAGLAFPFLLLGYDRDQALVLEGAGVPAWWAFGAANLAGVGAGVVLGRRGAGDGLRGRLVGVCLACVVVTGAAMVAFCASDGRESMTMGLYAIGLASVATIGAGGAVTWGRGWRARDRSVGGVWFVPAGGSALAGLAMLGVMAWAAPARLASRLESAGAAVIAERGLPARPIAKYRGRGTFAIVIPGGDPGNSATRDALVTGGMIIDRFQFNSRDEMSHVEIGHEFDVALVGTGVRASGSGLGGAGGSGVGVEPSELVEARLVRLTSRFKHGDHFHDLSFTVVQTHRVQSEDIIAYAGATAISPNLATGVLLGIVMIAGVCAAAGAAQGAGRGLIMPSLLLVLGTQGVGLTLGLAGAMGLVVGVLGSGLIAAVMFGGDEAFEEDDGGLGSGFRFECAARATCVTMVLIPGVAVLGAWASMYYGPLLR